MRYHYISLLVTQSGIPSYKKAQSSSFQRCRARHDTDSQMDKAPSSKELWISIVVCCSTEMVVRVMIRGSVYLWASSLMTQQGAKITIKSHKHIPDMDVSWESPLMGDSQWTSLCHSMTLCIAIAISYNALTQGMNGVVSSGARVRVNLSLNSLSHGREGWQRTYKKARMCSEHALCQRDL